MSLPILPINDMFKSPKLNQMKRKCKCKGWTNKEKKALAQTWLDVSEDLTTGDDQSGPTFKRRVWKSFCASMKECRFTSQVYSKWRTANKNSMEFNDIYISATRNPQSGANEVDVLAKIC